MAAHELNREDLAGEFAAIARRGLIWRIGAQVEGASVEDLARRSVNYLRILIAAWDKEIGVGTSPGFEERVCARLSALETALVEGETVKKLAAHQTALEAHQTGLDLARESIHRLDVQGFGSLNHRLAKLEEGAHALAAAIVSAAGK